MWGIAATATERIRPKSALTPAVMLNIVNLTPLMYTLHMAQGMSWSVVPFLIFPLVGVYQILFFTHTDPDRLQNEHHVEKKIALNNRFGFKSDGKLLEVTIPVGEILVNNPIIEHQGGLLK